ncbi:MAG: glycosyltransferase [Cyanobacteria bacterium RYN_339]|nr:glycosyltransferase [Cyanobacteria bacterium RYN_339]
MKIALFHNLRAGGAKRALYEYARVLAARGHHLDAFTLSTADEAFLPLAPLVRAHHVEPLELPQPLATRWMPLALQYLNLAKRLGQLDALDAAHRRVAARIDAGGYDLAFVHHDFLVQAPYVLRHLRTPSVYYCQEPLRRYYEYREPDPPATGFKGRVRAAWYAPIEPRYAARHQADDLANARAAGLILANSEYSREAIAKAYGKFPLMAPLGVDATHFHPMSDVAEERAVITVGRFQANKDQALVIEAVGRLADRPTVILVGESTGVPAYRDALVAQAARLGVPLEIHEHVADEALIRQYNRAALAVFTPILEPFGFVPLEAAACGRPTVGVREAGVRETVRHEETGLLVERDPAAVAAAIARLLADPAERHRMGEAALADARARWTWSHAADVLELRFKTFLGA